MASAPLLAQKDVLAHAFAEAVIEPSPKIDRHQDLRRRLKGCVVVITGAAQIPYIFVTPNSTLVASANVTAYYILQCMSGLKTINEAYGPKRQYELILLSSKETEQCSRSVVNGSAGAISLCAQIPWAMPALDYCGDWRVVGFLVNEGAGALFLFRSIRLSLDHCEEMRREAWNATSQKIFTLRDDLLEYAAQFEEEFVKKPEQQKLAQIAEFRRIKQGRESVLHRAYSYVCRIVQEPIQKAHETCCHYLRTATGIFLTSCYETALGQYAWNKIEEHLVSNGLIAMIFAGAVFATTLYVTGDSILRTTHRLVNSVHHYLTTGREYTLADQLRPKLTFVLKFLGTAVDILALGTTLKIWGDFYQGSNAKLFFQSTVCTSVFFLLFTATLDLIDSVVEDLVRAYGTDEEIDILAFRDELRQVQFLLKNCSHYDLTEFLAGCPEEMAPTLIHRLNLTIGELQDHLRSDLLNSDYGTMQLV